MSLKKLKIIIVVVFIFMGCSKSNNYDASCNFLADINIVTSLNLNLSQYNQLTFPSNPVYIPNIGNGGVIVNNTGVGYVAFDAADPNHVFSECSILSINGIEAVCGCENNKYNLVTGQPMENPELRCSLKPYFVESSGNSLIISN